MRGAAAVLREGGVPPGGRVLVVGMPEDVLGALRTAGYRTEAHRLDTNPVANLRGHPFTPPVVEWPTDRAAYDAVLLGADLAMVVDDEAAVAEAARSLRPGGLLVVAVPNTGPLAWLDAANAYRYVRDITRRGPRLPESRGVGWRRHYGEHDLRDLLAPAFAPPRFWTEGVGAGEGTRLTLLLLFRWLLQTERGAPVEAAASAAVGRWERAIRPGRWGSTLIAVAARKRDTAS